MYFEMCEAVGSEPIPEEIPVDSSDLAWETVQALNCYGMVSETWSSMGTYLGKNFSDLRSIMDLNRVTELEEDYTINTVRFIDGIVSRDIARKQKQASKKNYGKQR